MISRRSLLGVIAAIPVFIAGAAMATSRRSFDHAAFEAALAAGGPVLIDVYAPWCSTCRAQSTVLEALFARPEYAGFQVFVIDYDSQKDLMRRFAVQQRSTLIAFTRGVEVGRIVGDTRTESIDALLARALQAP